MKTWIESQLERLLALLFTVRPLTVAEHKKIAWKQWEHPKWSN
jgi:hypothetical protein